MFGSLAKSKASSHMNFVSTYNYGTSLGPKVKIPNRSISSIWKLS